MAKQSKEVKELKKQETEKYQELFENLFFLLVFPIFGIVLVFIWLYDSITEIHNIHKKIKEQKIKDIIKEIIIIKDENGFVKDIKL